MKKIRKQKITTKTILPILLISLILLFCLTTVSAANDTIYVNTTGNDTTGNGSAENPYFSIQKGIDNLNPSGTIYLANGTYKGTGNTKITINKNMSIIGESQTGTIIDGENTNWIFHIQLGFTVLFQHLTLANGLSDTGAIFNYGNLTAENCTFKGNNADGSGGAICNSWDGTCNITNCTFISNTADIGGGAIFQGGNGIFTITHCNFTNNTAKYGGAINTGNRDLIVKNCTFTNNIAEDGGAILAWTGGTMNLVSCNFINNSANGTSIQSGNGGAIYILCPSMITSCSFTNNKAVNKGGAIFSAPYNSINKMNFCRFYNNTASLGSAICNSGFGADVENNWWSSNNPNWSNLIYGFTNNPAKWVILSVNAAPKNINNTQNSTITADLNHNMNGAGNIETFTGHIPDCPITLYTPWGSFTNSGINHSITMDTINGVMTATFYAIEGAAPLNVKVTATADNYTTNKTESAYININKTADLYINITSDKRPKVGELFTLTYKLGNKGPDNATNVTITIPLPQGFELTNISGDGNWTYNSTTNTITWTLTNVPVGDPYLYITGKVTKAGSYMFGASITSETYNINTQSVNPITVEALPTANAASETIGMQNTGLPIPALVLALLAVFGGLVLPRMK
ncbi:hypothetical protein [Methanobacterium sp. ACI-7]|uniref:hypothetical protein n=1 Tax=unclassified Methanobacterium TaxID=2627676 RepID=UPI0039C3DCD9